MQRHVPFAAAVGGAFLSVLCLASASVAATIHVPADQATIQAAVTAASAGDEIVVAPGTYVENVSIDKNLTLTSSGGAATTTIQGISGVGALGAIVVTNSTTAITIGGIGHGFTVLGIDNGNPAIENAAIYFQGGHTGATVRGNNIVAQGDNGLQTEWGAGISGFLIDGNEFSGATFFDPPLGSGFGDQFTQPNRPRQLVVIGCGGCASTSNVIFSNNLISGTAGGINPSNEEQGNTLVTIDGQNSTIVGNSFAGTTTRFGTSLRCRGAGTSIVGNDFSSAGLTPTTGHVYVQASGQSTGAVAGANSFDKSVWVDAATGTIGWLIQSAVAVVPPGTTIHVGPGDYEEQLHIASDLTLQGQGAGVTTIQSPTTLTLSYTTSATNFPIVFIDGADNAVLRDLTVDGLGRGNGNYRFQGVAFWNSGGALFDCDIVGIMDTPFSGAQHGNAVYAYNTTGGPYAIEVGGCNVNTFQKNGLTLLGAGLTHDVHDCVVSGAGHTTVIAQNGMQFGYESSGAVSDCTVDGFFWDGPTWTSTGVLLYAGTDIDLTDVMITDSQTAVYNLNTNGDMSEVESTGDQQYGAIIWNDTLSSARRGGEQRAPQASPVEEDGVPSFAGESLVQAVSLVGGCWTGSGEIGSLGLVVFSDGGPVTLNVQNARVTNYDYGVGADGVNAHLSITNSAVYGNLTAGYDNTTGAASQLATRNWWGAADGPGGPGGSGGSGDAILGTGVAHSPWRTDDASATVCAFTPSVNNDVGPTDPGGCISGSPASCVLVPIDVIRSDNAEMRGFSVDIQLTDLVLCDAVGPVYSITEGTYLSSAGNTSGTFQVIDHGGGSYTIDCAILGATCGQDAPTGTLFTVGVTTAGNDGLGTIEVTDVTLRDCSNGPIPGTPGDALDLSIDTVPPSPIADLSTVQVESGNDGDGTTAVTVTFTAPGDADLVEVYRAPYVDGFGDNAYPEYDDEPGATAPSAPAYPPTSPWEPTVVTASGQPDETAERGYWYYVVFTRDACGNVSSASNMTDGVLNYHLGDVSNGLNQCEGDNQVSIEDITLLGANYGITLPYQDPVNCLDVGPTDDFSVDGFPATDNLVNFEDLILFAINYGAVSFTEPMEDAVALGPDAARPQVGLETAARQLDGTLVARLRLDQPADLTQGVHARVQFGPGLALVGVDRGELLERQDAQVFFDTIEADGAVCVDVAALGRGTTLDGSGVLAVLRFRQTDRAAGPRLVEVDLRDTRNRDLRGSADEFRAARGDDPASGSLPALGDTGLLGASPNPFEDSASIHFRLAQAEDVRVEIFDVTGRSIRALHPGALAAGEHTVVWDGRSELGERARAGVYLYRLQVGPKVWSAKLHRNP